VASDLPAWAGSVDAGALERLLAIQGELDWLDYKRQVDLSSSRGLVEFAKDVGAMMITGGYILVGADDNGQASGDIEHLDLFDPATLHAKLAKYLPRPFEIRSATHMYQGQVYALIYVMPHQDGFCIFERDGAYLDGKDQTVVFRAGDVFARHGTRSERWNQRDVPGIKERLLADNDRGAEQQNEAITLLQDLPRCLNTSVLWLAMAVVPEHRLADFSRTDPDAAKQILCDWHNTQAPIESHSPSDVAYRKPGGVIVVSRGLRPEPSVWWQLHLYDAGEATGAYVLAHRGLAHPGHTPPWYGLPNGIVSESEVIPVRRDEVEIRLLALLDMLTAYATKSGAGGRAVIVSTLLTPPQDGLSSILLVDESVDDDGRRQGWEWANPHGYLGLRAVVMVPIASRVRLADMGDPARRIQAAHDLAADLLTIFYVDQPRVLTAKGVLNPSGAATDHQEMVYRHVHHLGKSANQVSPPELP
jgi:hypothetical protein